MNYTQRAIARAIYNAGVKRLKQPYKQIRDIESLNDATATAMMDDAAAVIAVCGDAGSQPEPESVADALRAARQQRSGAAFPHEHHPTTCPKCRADSLLDAAAALKAFADEQLKGAQHA